MLRKHALAAIAAAGLAVVTMLVMPSHGRTTGWHDIFSPSLPDLTGPHQVGVRRMLLTDESRRDPWVGSEPRRLMVDVHYPAGAGSLPLEYYYRSNAATELGTLAWAPGQEQRLGLVPGEVNWLFRTHGHEWAPVAAGRYPVVLLSAGPGRRRTDWRSLAEDLASHGYIVASIDHPYDSSVVELFPTRRVVAPRDATNGVSAETANETRADDIRYVATHLADVDPEVARSADPSRIGLVGWVGLGTRRSALLSTPGVRAIASIGPMPQDVGSVSARQAPVLVIAPRRAEPRAVPGAWRTVAVAGTTERGLHDDGIVLRQVAKCYPRTAAVIREEIGTPPPDDVIHRYVAGFLDIQLKGRPDNTFGSPPPPGITISS